MTGKSDIDRARGLPYLLRPRKTNNVKRLIERLFGREDWSHASQASQGWQAIEDESPERLDQVVLCGGGASAATRNGVRLASSTTRLARRTRWPAKSGSREMSSCRSMRMKALPASNCSVSSFATRNNLDDRPMRFHPRLLGGTGRASRSRTEACLVGDAAPASQLGLVQSMAHSRLRASGANHSGASVIAWRLWPMVASPMQEKPPNHSSVKRVSRTSRRAGMRPRPCPRRRVRVPSRRPRWHSPCIQRPNHEMCCEIRVPSPRRSSGEVPP